MNREEKKKRRKQMLTMMNEDPNWYLKMDKSEIIYALADGFVPQTKETPVSKKKSWSSLTRVDFLYLIAQGYKKEDFRRDYDVSEYQWIEWRKKMVFVTKETGIYDEKMPKKSVIFAK